MNLYKEVKKDAADDMRRAREKAAKIAPARAVLGKLSRAVKAIAAREDKAGNSFHHFAYSSYDGPVLSMSIYGLDGFGEGRLLKVLERLESAGIEFHKSEDCASIGSRTFKAKAGGVSVELAAYLKSDSAKCSRVVERVEVKEVPVYKLVCH